VAPNSVHLLLAETLLDEAAATAAALIASATHICLRMGASLNEGALDIKLEPTHEPAPSGALSSPW
jgi:hypothetical protein